MKKLTAFLLSLILILSSFTGCLDFFAPEQEPIIALSEIPEFDGETPYVTINGNVPFFTEEEITSKSFEEYSDLDSLGRCGVAIASIGVDLMPTEERESISSVKPSGWINVSYDIVEGGYLYDRCHLIGFQLTGENANKENLITGTSFFNVSGMLPFENDVAEYLGKNEENHVMYRVTPIYDGSNLVASGVLMEAMSVEDNGKGITFCVYVYNNQPGIVIDYKTGKSRLATDEELPTTPDADELPSDSDEKLDTDTPKTYIINITTGKFHLPECYYAQKTGTSNRREETTTKEDLIANGKTPCSVCLD